MCDKPHTQHWVDIDINDYDYPLPDDRIRWRSVTGAGSS